MKGYDAKLVVEQIPIVTGMLPRVVTKKVCKVCGLRVSKIMQDQFGRLYRRHTQRKLDGTKCSHGQKQTDPANSQWTSPRFAGA